jgi:predicted nucleic acid-binding protein
MIKLPEVCLDASFLLEILFEDKFAGVAAGWWRRAAEENTNARVPPLFHAEVTSAVRRRVYRGLLESAAAMRILHETLSWPVHAWYENEPLLQQSAYDFATQLNQSKAYDGQYLAVADLLSCELWTADERLYNSVRDRLPWVRYVGATV